MRQFVNRSYEHSILGPISALNRYFYIRVPGMEKKVPKGIGWLLEPWNVLAQGTKNAGLKIGRSKLQATRCRRGTEFACPVNSGRSQRW